MTRIFEMTILSFIAAFGLTIGSADAQDREQNVPGQFDYHVLSLSWSPSFCETATGNARRQQCGPRPYSFVVHGLWALAEKGFAPSRGGKKTVTVSEQRRHAAASFSNIGLLQVLE